MVIKPVKRNKELRAGDIIEYRHSEAGGGTCKKLVLDFGDLGLFVERPYNYAKYFRALSVCIISVNGESRVKQ